MAPTSTKHAKQSKTSLGKKNNTRRKSKYFSGGRESNLKRIKRRSNEEINPKTGSTKAATLLAKDAQTAKSTVNSPELFTKRLCRSFFDTPTEILAVALLGKLLCRLTDDGEKLCGKIVETEAYLGEIDPACHSYGGRRTTRTEPVYGPPGTSYVYFIYGMYHCFNISSQERGACVLIRALEPVEGLEPMRKFRNEKRLKRSTLSKAFKNHEMCNGPSKLCLAMAIRKDNLNNVDLVTSQKFWVEDPGVEKSAFTVVHTTRIGIESYGKESVLKPYRYYIFGNKHVSVRDKNAESQLNHLVKECKKDCIEN